MKTHFILCSISALSLFCVILLAISCSKSEESKTDYRVSSSNYYMNDNLSESFQMVYESEKLSLMNGMTYNTKGDSAKTEYDYSNKNKVIAFYYQKSGNSWIKVGKTDYEFQNFITCALSKMSINQHFPVQMRNGTGGSLQTLVTTSLI